MQIAIEVRLEDDAVLGDLAKAAEAEDLKAPRIGEDGVGPGHEAVQPSHLADELVAGAQVEMVGVGQQDFHAEVFGEIALGETFDGGLRAYGHEDGGFDGAVGGVQEAGAGTRVGALGDYFEGNGAQIEIVARRGGDVIAPR
ncbi:conserved hypothetical protein [Candidatus Sulfopaludibacter sp. SbA4]|nr:conserved hypothetical protein [Candidatus Sulfopaludibacter sp. SbA4]